MVKQKRDHVGKIYHRGRIHKGLHVEFVAPVEKPEGLAAVSVEWDPRIPQKLTAKILKKYERERAVFFNKLAKEHGIKILCVDV